MTISLVTISHPTEPLAEVPFVGGRCPMTRIAIETWKARSIAAMGFAVEVHEEPYDPVGAANRRATALAAALAAAAPAEAPAAPLPDPAPPTPAAEPAPAPEPEPAPAPEPEPTPAPAEEEEGEALSEEELEALRVRIEALPTRADAEALMAEYSIALDPMPVKLKDIKAALIALIYG